MKVLAEGLGQRLDCQPETKYKVKRSFAFLPKLPTTTTHFPSLMCMSKTYSHALLSFLLLEGLLPGKPLLGDICVWRGMATLRVVRESRVLIPYNCPTLYKILFAFIIPLGASNLVRWVRQIVALSPFYRQGN